MLNTDVNMRCNIGQLQLCHWMRGFASPLTPYKSQMYTEKDQLPKAVFDAICDFSSVSQPSTLSRQSVCADHLVKSTTSSSRAVHVPLTAASGNTTTLKEVHQRQLKALTQQRRTAGRQSSTSYV